MQVGLVDATRTLPRNSTAEPGAEIVNTVCQTRSLEYFRAYK